MNSEDRRLTGGVSLACFLAPEQLAELDDLLRDELQAEKSSILLQKFLGIDARAAAALTLQRRAQLAACTPPPLSIEVTELQLLREFIEPQLDTGVSTYAERMFWHDTLDKAGAFRGAAPQLSAEYRQRVEYLRPFPDVVGWRAAIDALVTQLQRTGHPVDRARYAALAAVWTDGVGASLSSAQELANLGRAAARAHWTNRASDVQYQLRAAEAEARRLDMERRGQEAKQREQEAKQGNELRGKLRLYPGRPGSLVLAAISGVCCFMMALGMIVGGGDSQSEDEKIGAYIAQGLFLVILGLSFIVSVKRIVVRRMLAPKWRAQAAVFIKDGALAPSSADGNALLEFMVRTVKPIGRFDAEKSMVEVLRQAFPDEPKKRQQASARFHEILGQASTKYSKMG